MPIPKLGTGHGDLMRRAYSTFIVKDINEDQRVIEGMATTPTTDRVGDIVEPRGAKFNLPIPLLWQHNSREPVGHVTQASVTDVGITIRAKFAQVLEPGRLKDRLDEAWQSIKHGLVRGLSIGFLPMEDGMEPINPKEPWGGQRFTAWDWLELSAVTIPANIEASIQTIKSIDNALLAASGRGTRKVVRLDPQSPGVSGQIAADLKGINMKTIKEQITVWEAKRQATAARMKALMDASGEKGETLDASKAEEYDGLEAEVVQIDLHLKRLGTLDKENVAAALPVSQTPAPTPKAPARSGAIVLPNIEPGVRMARYAMALICAKGNFQDAAQIARSNKQWMDQTPEIEQILKTAVLAGDTTTAGWASELVYAQNLQADFIEFLRPQTILGRIAGWRTVPFNMRVGSQTAGSTAYWVGQGRAIPASALATSSATLGITKMAGLLSIDDELARSSSPSAELLVRNDLAAQIAQFSDTSLIDPTQGGQTNIQPVSLTYGVTPTSPSGTNFAAIATDVKAVFSSLITNNIDIAPCVWVMTATTALALSLMQTSLGNPQFPTININGGTWMGLPVVVSQNALMSGSPDYLNMIVLIQPREVFMADDGAITISVSNEASIEMLDNPTNRAAGSSVATTVVSMFQTNSLAIKAVRYINWSKRRTQAVQFIRTAAYA